MSVPRLEHDTRSGDTLHLRAADGAEARITAHGAHVISWKPRDGEERLFLSRRAEFGGTHSIRGGIPVVFPQFAAEGPLPKHGLLRNHVWRLLDATAPSTGEATARFAIDDAAATRALWPHRFTAELHVALSAQRLRVTLHIVNRGDEAFAFTAALHSYLRVADIADIRIAGLDGLHYRDSAAGGRLANERAAELRIEGEVDRIYFDAASRLELIEPQRRLRVASDAFADAVIWNPGEKLAAALKDLEPEGWRRYVCIESAAIGRPVELAPGARWQGAQELEAG